MLAVFEQIENLILEFCQANFHEHVKKENVHHS